jgi:hypothetical protein
VGREMTNRVAVGDRVRLLSCTDEYTRLQPGELGTVNFIDDAGTVHVNWDSGSSLGLVPGEDAWEPLGPAVRGDLPPCPACGGDRLRLERRLRAKEVGTFSVAGSQLKFPAVEVLWLVCGECGVESEAKA